MDIACLYTVASGTVTASSAVEVEVETDEASDTDEVDEDGGGGKNLQDQRSRMMFLTCPRPPGGSTHSLDLPGGR